MLRDLLIQKTTGPKQLQWLQIFSLIKLFIFSCPEGNKLPPCTRVLPSVPPRASTKLALVKKRSPSSGPQTFMLLLRTLLRSRLLWCVVDVLCVCWCVRWCVWCGTLKTTVCRFRTPPCAPCAPAKRPCRIRHGRFGGTHGDVVNLHTEAF